MLPTVTQVQFKGLNCLTLESEKRYLRVDTAVECSVDHSPDYLLLLVFTLPLIILYQSVPLLWAYQLYKNRARLNPPIEDAGRAYERRARDHDVAHLNFLFAGQTLLWPMSQASSAVIIYPPPPPPQTTGARCTFMKW